MCGIAGLLSPGTDPATLRRHAAAMAGALRHRGPDDDGIFVDPASSVALAFRRLAILDLSPLGHQPMTSASGRFTLIYNGEVFNFAELRADLEGRGAVFRGRSDTEVILAGFEAWGIRSALQRFVGMFALAVWDAEHRTLTLARDRLGIKPLYLFRRGGLLLFGSELKAMVGHPDFDRTLDVDSVARYLRYLYVPGPGTIYAHAEKLPPGHLITVPADGRPTSGPEPFWDLLETVERGRTTPFGGTDEEAVEELDRRLLDAVGMRMIADVPLGAFLSGGIDSSAVVALMQARSSGPVRTYSIAFPDRDYNEADCAREVARHLGTDHHQIDVTGDDALALVPRMAEIYDEPLADTAQLPLTLMCAMARPGVTVALTGDGGDEVFAGYTRYLKGAGLIGRIGRLPGAVRGLLRAGTAGLARPGQNPLAATVARLAGLALGERAPGERMAKLARVLGEPDTATRYRALMSVWDDPLDLVPGASGRDDRVVERLRAWPASDLIRGMQLADQLTYLPDDQLAKVDRASMSCSLEVRVPLLDHRLVEFSWSLPTRLLVREGRGKWLLRQVLDRYVPRRLIDRPKMGFSVPIDRWLRGPLKAWAEDHLQPGELERDGLLRAGPIRAAWDGLQRGRGDTALGLWAVVLFQAWRRRWT